MIKDIIELLKSDDYFDASEAIQIAKGKYKTPTSFNDWLNYVKRRIHGRQNN